MIDPISRMAQARAALELADAATAGPWAANQSDDDKHLDWVAASYQSGAPDHIALIGARPDQEPAIAQIGRSDLEQQNADSEFIAASRTGWPDAERTILAWGEALQEMEKRKDGAYEERNHVVAALAKLAISTGCRAGRAKTAIEGWSGDWHGCVYIDLPTGQVSWHYHDSQAAMFEFLPPYEGAWDGHDTPEKYRRVDALQIDTAAQARIAELERELAEAKEQLTELASELEASELRTHRARQGEKG